LHVTELLICSATVAPPVEAVNTQHGGLSAEQSCKYQKHLNLNGMAVKSLQDSFLLCISTACYQVKDNSPISLTVPVCPSHWMAASYIAVPLVRGAPTVFSPCHYTKTGLQIPLLCWKQSCDALLNSTASPTAVES